MAGVRNKATISTKYNSNNNKKKTKNIPVVVETTPTTIKEINITKNYLKATTALFIPIFIISKKY